MYDAVITGKRYRKDLSDLTEKTGFVCVEYAIRKWIGNLCESSNINPSPVEQAVGFSTDHNRDYKECTFIAKYPIDKPEEFDVSAEEFFSKFEIKNGNLVWPDEEGHDKYANKIFKDNAEPNVISISWEPNLKWSVTWHLVPSAKVKWNDEQK